MPNLDGLPEFLRRARTVNLLVASEVDGRDNPPVIQRLNIHEDVAAQFLGVAQESLPAEATLRAYDPGYKPETTELCYVEYEDQDYVSSLVDTLHQVDQAELFSEDEDFIKKLRFYAIVVGGVGGRQAIFLRHYSQKKELKRHAAFALMLKRGNYDRVREKIFLFDNAVDCFSWDGALYIKSISQFQRIFKYFEELRSKARDTIQRVHQRVPIHNLDEFQSACVSSSVMLTKLAAIANKPYLERVTFDDVERTIQEFNLEIEIKREGGGPELVYDSSREHRWLILKLLDDDYLGSTMTHEKYEVNSKIRTD
jgi:hypothetical protein